jgi:hypothetical protein
MKKFNLVLLTLLVSFSFLSCDNEDETGYVQKDFLTGKWIITKRGVVNNSGKLVYFPYVNDADCDLDNYTFNEDLSYSFNNFSTASGTCENVATIGEYSAESNTVTLIYPEENSAGEIEMKERILNIKQLTDNSLEFTFTNTTINRIVFLKLIKE